MHRRLDNALVLMEEAFCATTILELVQQPAMHRTAMPVVSLGNAAQRREV